MSNTKAVTKKVRGSYVNVFRPRVMRNDDGTTKEEYSMQLIIPKTETETIKRIKDAIAAAKVKKWGSEPPRGLKSPLRDADLEAEQNDETVKPELKGCYFVNAKNKDKPRVVDRDNMDLIDPSEFVSGDYCRVSMNAYGYDVSGNKGVAFGLQLVQFLAKGEPLGNTSRPEDDFAEDLDDEEDWAA